ncbi:hypothetical protein IE4803_CH04490 [Rhizobium etli bv. phaseoli str. IE4803]|nr:hypothetical protein IE4803_CH04490 [Rhizobium etli bv. phaseoli str. IE4803]
MDRLPQWTDFLQASRRFFEKISKIGASAMVLTLFWRRKWEIVGDFSDFVAKTHVDGHLFLFSFAAHFHAQMKNG